MIKFIDGRISKIAMAIVVSGMSLACPAYAHDDDMSRKAYGPQRVEERIRTLHDKLHLTSDQEDQWRKVARIMRENERDIHRLVERRHEEEPATAVDDLRSYEEIADAHAQGLRNLIPAFQSLYKNLSDEQKENADDIFGTFEGHEARRNGAHAAGDQPNAAPNESR